MAGIATRYVTENEFNTEMSIEELSKHAPVLDILLTDKIKRDQLTAEAELDTVNTCQILPKETIRDLAQHIIQDNFGEAEVKVIAKALAESASNASADLLQISRLRKELQNLKASEKIISATLIPDITRSANKIQKERNKQCEDEGIDYLDHFSLESVKERLDIVIGYAKNQEQQDIPRVFRSLEKNEKRARELLVWIQEAISSRQLRDPGKPRVLWFNTFLKKDEFLPETGKLLLPSSLRKLGAVFAIILNCAKNLSEAMTIASEALRHSPNNHASPAKNYTIVNYRKRGQPDDQAKAIKIFDEN
ncbi:hypothetical protein RhiirC2_786460 [Rhizophagus irregularis]|uniref:Uncharacterized protein n=1 Tax=Rhizophagus irregularis TaxID=588596 RepID=A0A2N1MUD9_9GLOM|nr:hypothetical protein RhiirC2_786460 [Rhizophagus irregularis]